MAPQKKHASVRSRATKAATKATLHALDPATIEIPPLPSHPDGLEWQEQTAAWWEDVWSSPMAAEFVQADIHGVFRLAILVDDFWVNPSTKTHAEIRIAQQAYGLTPYDRRRLEWTVETAEAAKDRGNSRRRMAQMPQPPAGDDPRLRIVE